MNLTEEMFWNLPTSNTMRISHL